MDMRDHRLQIRPDEARYTKAALEAKARGTSVAAVIREAIDRLPTDLDEPRNAIASVLAAEPMPVPDDPQSFRNELSEAQDRRDMILQLRCPRS